MTILRIQGPCRNTKDSGSSMTVTLTSNPVNGNTLIALTSDNSGNYITSLSGPTGVTWDASSIESNGISCQIWRGVVTGSPSAKVVTITFLGNLSDVCIVNILEYSGLLTSSETDQSNTNSSTGTSADTGQTPTTQQASELWIGQIIAHSASTTVTQTDGTSGAYNFIDGADYVYAGSYHRSLAGFEKIVSSTGQAKGISTIANNPDGVWSGCIITLKGPTTTTKTVTYSIDNVLKALGVTAPFTIDSLFKKLNVTKINSIDSLIKSLGIPVTVPIDVLFMLSPAYYYYYYIDALLKKTDIIVNGISGSYNIDMITSDVRQYIIDLLTKKSNLTVTEQIDLGLILKNLSKTNTIDIHTKKLNIQSTFGLDVLIMAIPSPTTVTVDGIDLDFIIKFERVNKKTAFTPEWVNQTEAVETYMWHKNLLELEYTFRATEDTKWSMDQSFRGHAKVYLADFIHNLFGSVWISKIESKWNDINYERPWETTIHLLAMPSEITSGDATVVFDSAVEFNGDIFYSAGHKGSMLIDGVLTTTLPDTETLDYGVHDVFFNQPSNSTGMYEWLVTGNVIILDSSGDWATIFVFGNGSVIAVYSDPLPPILVELSTDDWAYFKREGEIWIPDPSGSGGGAYVSNYLVYIPDLLGPQGGGYYNSPSGEQVIASQPESNSQTAFYGDNWYGQSFTLTEPTEITGVILNLFASSGYTPTGNITVSIRAVDNNGFPTGPDLASASITGSSIPTNSPKNFEFRFLSHLVLQPNRYAIIFRAPDATFAEAVATPYKNMIYDYSGGVFLASEDGGNTWSASIDNDFWFEVMGYQ